MHFYENLLKKNKSLLAGCQVVQIGAMAATDGFYSNWHGPYYTGPVVDAWGHNYFLDEDYDFDGQAVTAIGSYGPNEVVLNRYDDDDIVLIITAD